MSYFLLDVEADGPIPGTNDFSMVSFGAVLVEPGLQHTFHGKLCPISEKWIPSALAVSGYTREETLQFPAPLQVMQDFEAWIKSVNKGRPMFVSDNNGFDYMFLTWYFEHFLGRNPFGHSSTNMGSLYKGLVGDMHENFKHLRKTKHDHNPVNDSKGNAEALLLILEAMKGRKTEVSKLERFRALIQELKGVNLAVVCNATRKAIKGILKPDRFNQLIEDEEKAYNQDKNK